MQNRLFKLMTSTNIFYNVLGYQLFILERGFMLLSLALILLVGMSMGWFFKKLHLPSLTGMLITGIVLGPYVLNLIDGSILNISADIRKIALIIILTRAGLSLNMEDLKRVGRPAILMCFVPACFEVLGMVLLAPKILGISVLDAAIMGAVVGAVSPAVIVPKMLKLMDEGYGKKHSIPQLILAGASVDDVFVIVLFTAFTGLAQGNSISVASFVNIPISIVIGIAVGMLTGYGLAYFFEKVHLRDTAKVIVVLAVSFILTSLEDAISVYVPFAALIAIMAIGVALQKKRLHTAKNLSAKFNKLWVAAEIMLFVLVGASVNINYAMKAGLAAVILIILVLLFRMVGVYLCLLKTNLPRKERIFCMIAYTPKATVQAAIGGVPLVQRLSVSTILPNTLWILS